MEKQDQNHHMHMYVFQLGMCICLFDETLLQKMPISWKNSQAKVHFVICICTFVPIMNYVPKYKDNIFRNCSYVKDLLLWYKWHK